MTDIRVRCDPVMTPNPYAWLSCLRVSYQASLSFSGV